MHSSNLTKLQRNCTTKWSMLHEPSRTDSRTYLPMGEGGSPILSLPLGGRVPHSLSPIGRESPPFSLSHWEGGSPILSLSLFRSLSLSLSPPLPPSPFLAQHLRKLLLEIDNAVAGKHLGWSCAVLLAFKKQKMMMITNKYSWEISGVKLCGLVAFKKFNKNNDNKNKWI